MKATRNGTTRWLAVGYFYRGGSYRRWWELAVSDGRAYLIADDGRGRACNWIGDVAGELRYSDARGKDDPSRNRDHHAFAKAVRRGLDTLGLGHLAG
jgi:hypothetical protein